jgi:predicted membrane-bound spermidine synthase
MSLFTAVFMAGLALGAILRRHLLKSASAKGLVCFQLILAGFSAGIPCLIEFSASLIHLPFLVHLLYLSATGLISVVTGMIFSMSMEVPGKNRQPDVPAVYGADMAGASLGAFLTTLLLIPLAGIQTAPYLMALLNLLIGLIMLIQQRTSNPV